jgi:site-specific recombinase XerD
VTHLRQAMLDELQRRNYATTTVQYYIQTVEQFGKHFRTRPDRLNQQHIRTYQTYLLQERKLHPHSVKRHVAALRFFFVKTLRRPYGLDDIPYPKVPRRLPTILTVDEVTRLIDAARTLTDRTMLMVLYSTGMRNAEMRRLHLKDIDSRSMLIHIQRGKGGRDRYVPLSPTLRDSHLTRPERYTPSALSIHRAQVRSGDVCLRSPEADTAASIIAPHWVRFGVCTLSGNNAAPGTATHQPARTGLRTIQRL